MDIKAIKHLQNDTLYLVFFFRDVITRARVTVLNLAEFSLIGNLSFCNVITCKTESLRKNLINCASVYKFAHEDIFLSFVDIQSYQLNRN